jgi:hypothetical protein
MGVDRWVDQNDATNLFRVQLSQPQGERSAHRQSYDEDVAALTSQLAEASRNREKPVFGPSHRKIPPPGPVSG